MTAGAGPVAALNQVGDIDVPSGSDGSYPVVRYAIMLDKNLFSGEYAIAPIDDKIPYGGGSGSGGTSANYRNILSTQNFSYAMLALVDTSSVAVEYQRETFADYRCAEWAETMNSQAAIMADRNTLANSPYDASSIWTGTDPWEGSLVWNDNHAIFQTSTTADTRYGNHPTNGDHLFGAFTPPQAPLTSCTRITSPAGTRSNSVPVLSIPSR